MKILTFYAPKDKDYEKVEGESMTDQEDYESLPDLIARVIRGEVRSQPSLGFTVGVDDDSDEAFESCDDADDVDIVPAVLMDESGFTSSVSRKEKVVPQQSSAATVEAPSVSAEVQSNNSTSDGGDNPPSE